MKKTFGIIAIVLTLCTSGFAQSHKTKQPHKSEIIQLEQVKSKDSSLSYFTASEDGFLIKWNDDNEGEHFQITDLRINLISVSPNGNDIAVYETDGGLINRVTVWDWKNLSKKFQKNYSSTINSLKFSAKGTYLMVGTASIDGVEFLKTSGWSVENKLKQTANISNYLYTSDSEKTAFFYSAGGSVSYYNMQNGNQKLKFSLQKGLSQCMLFNGNAFFAGVISGKLCIFDALKGTLLLNIPCSNPIILSNETDSDLYFLDYDGTSAYNLKKITTTKNVLNKTPETVAILKNIKGYSLASTGFKTGNQIVIGTRNGEVIRYVLNDDNTYESIAVTSNNFENIVDVSKSATSDDFYLLTKKAVYKTNYNDKSCVKLFDTQYQTNILTYQNNIILYSNNSRKEVTLVNLDTKKSEVLFTPQNNLQNLKICYYNDQAYLVEVESNTLVFVYNFANKSYKQSYAGIGIQDAIIANDGYLYVAKSTATNPMKPLLKVNLKTLETVPVSIDGNIAYSLSSNADNSAILGIMLSNDANDTCTYVFSFDVKKQDLKYILKFNEEDSDAFTNCEDNNLLTNIGKNVVYSYNVKNKKKSNYKRTASIPLKVSQNKNQIVILNDNGCISWCTTNSKQIIADWYLTSSGEWFIFDSKK